MQSHYKKFFTIQRQLLKCEIPEDLIPIFFDYLGKLDETVEELDNKHCFYKITHDKDAKAPDTHFGTYCNVCKKVMFLKTPKQLHLHCTSKGHRNHYKSYKGFSPRMYEIQHEIITKHYRWMKYRYKHRRRVLNTLKLTNIII